MHNYLGQDDLDRLDTALGYGDTITLTRDEYKEFERVYKKYLKSYED